MASAAWLVDMGYIVKTAKKGLFKVDYVAAEEVVRERFGDVRTFLFNSYDDAYGIPERLQRFYDGMRARGMSICLQPMGGSVEAGDHRQRRVDVDLAAHLVWQASVGVEWIVLTSGDQDLVPAVAIAKEHFGIKAALFTFRRNVSSDLRAITHEQIVFEEYEHRLARP